MTKNYVLKPIYNDENECINDKLSISMNLWIVLCQNFNQVDACHGCW